MFYFCSHAVASVRTSSYILCVRIERHHIIQRFGPGERVAQRMTRKAWQCDSCQEVTRADQPIPRPAPCKRCGNLAFVVVRDEEETQSPT